MTDHTIKVTWDQVSSIIVHELKDDAKYLKKDLAKRKKNSGNAIFSTDKEQDIAMIEKHIEALELVSKYYGS